MLFLETYHRAENFPYPVLIDKSGSPPGFPARAGQDSNSFGQPHPVLIIRSFLSIFLGKVRGNIAVPPLCVAWGEWLISFSWASANPLPPELYKKRAPHLRVRRLGKYLRSLFFLSRQPTMAPRPALLGGGEQGESRGYMHILPRPPGIEDQGH